MNNLLLLLSCFSIFSANSQPPQQQPNNIILLVGDGLRSVSVTDQEAPNLYRLRVDGVFFANSHSLMPTMTTCNASALATGHYLGDTGDFGNTLYSGFTLQKAAGNTIPYLENNHVIDELNDHFGGAFLNEETIIQRAQAMGYNTAVIGKQGVVHLFIPHVETTQTILVDDETGKPHGYPVPADIAARAAKEGIPMSTPERGPNAIAGDLAVPGTRVSNRIQSRYFDKFLSRVLLPVFKEAHKPFLIVYWSRDPDATEHGQGDSHQTLVPGVNGATSHSAVKNFDSSYLSLRVSLDSLGLANATDVLVSSDHGFSTISKQTDSSYAAIQSYPDVPHGFLPPGFLAIDLAHDLGKPLYDAYVPGKIIGENEHPSMTPARTASAFIGGSADRPEIVVAPNGGSALIYLLQPDRQKTATQIIAFLAKQNYIGGIFVNDSLGNIAGSLPMSAINLMGSSLMPVPSIVVSFSSHAAGCDDGIKCPALLSDVGLQQGQGMHGSFSRADTYNFMACIGPDFKRGFIDPAPVSNADIAQTIFHLLRAPARNKGSLTGRVIDEAFKGHSLPQIQPYERTGSADSNGRQMTLKGSKIGTTTYYDAAGYAGRVIGL